MKKVRFTLLAFLIIIILFNTIIYIVNNNIANGLKYKLLECPLPPNSELIDSASIAGKILGNGNGMQWFGIILVNSDITKDELSEWYKSHVDYKHTDTIYVFKQESSEILKGSNYFFNFYSDKCNCFQVQLFRNSAVGTESSIWESLLNLDLRGH